MGDEWEDGDVPFGSQQPASGTGLTAVVRM